MVVDAAQHKIAREGVGTVHVVSLGCPKNLVDSELMIGRLQQAGLALVDDAQTADVLLVNTCAFVEASKTESVDAILELAEHKAAHPGARLVVAGCLAQRYASELSAEMPEVDLFVGTGEVADIAWRLGLTAPSAAGLSASLSASPPVGPGVPAKKPRYLADHLEPRYVAPNTFSTWLKIAEGCSQGCSFCIIPKLRGTQRSRTIDDVIAEAHSLVGRGVLELNLVAQDLTHYGVDIDEPHALARLIRRLGEVPGLAWVRLLYCYPDGFDDELIAAIAETDNCCKYIDMPIQHATDSMLERMNRHTSRAAIDRTLDNLRSRVDDLVLRTTFIVGHPGETERDFEALLDFIGEQRFDHVGCFDYSREDGTLSARMPAQVSTAVKRFRQSEIMTLQRGISAAHMEARIGQRLDVLIEGLSDETDLLLQGRFAGQAPDIDGVVYINDAPADVGRGQLRVVEVTEAGDYDLVGHVVE